MAARGRFLKDERGYTLSEVLVTILIMTFVLGALSSMFQMSLRVFSHGNNKVEAVESARVGLEKMEREIRQAHPIDTASSQTHLLFNAASPTDALTLPAPDAEGRIVVNELSFGNDLGGPGDGVITCDDPCEYITYKLTNANGTAACTVAEPQPPCTLWRANGDNSGPVVENVAVNNAADGTANDGLSFTLLKSDGTDPADEGEVSMVLVKLNVVVDRGLDTPGTQTLTTAIDLRNR